MTTKSVRAESRDHLHRRMPTAIDDVVAERQRQVDIEHRTPAHDDEHQEGELAAAASAYAAHAAALLKGGTVRAAWPPDLWLWDAAEWKPKAPRP